MYRLSQGCVANMYAGKPLCCLTNPFLGHDAEPLKQAETPKKIMVIPAALPVCALHLSQKKGAMRLLYMKQAESLVEICVWPLTRREKVTSQI